MDEKSTAERKKSQETARADKHEQLKSTKQPPEDLEPRDKGAEVKGGGMGGMQGDGG